MIHTLTKTTAVIVSSTILATLSVNAVDMHGRAVTTYLGALVFGVQEEKGLCENGMVPVLNALTPYCIDAYEVSAGDECPYDDPTTNDETSLNIAHPECMPVSEPNVRPWRNITQPQAVRLCERAGKHLPTPDEWYKSALGTPDPTTDLGEEQCNTASNRAVGVGTTGGGMRCVSDVGAYDMVGNVWEWVDGGVVRGVWDGRELPATGYVDSVDVYGMPYTTRTSVDERFNNDRFWSDPTIDAGIMRGGYYQGGSHAGIYAVYTASPVTFYGDAVGFRCAVTLSHDE